MPGKQLLKDPHSGYSPINVKVPTGTPYITETGTLHVKYHPTYLQLEVACPLQVITRTYISSLK